jgi:cytochrome o ubiquinol oxidase subunit II
MSHKEKLSLILFIFVGVLVAVGLLTLNGNLAVFNPQGAIAGREGHLIIITVLLMLIVVIPVYVLAFFIAWKYREDNHKAEYRPDWDHDRRLEGAWWAIPGIIILVLSIITWQSSHQLDPFRKLNSAIKPLPVQVVALDWKWLFIYPEQNIASVNFVQFPVNRPIDFEITADAPMNSFWIPQLGGQIYAMSGMATQLHLQADHAGDYYGSSANISGHGFASMHFTARASSNIDFEQWVADVKQSPQPLTASNYKQLSSPGTFNHPIYYSSAQNGLFNSLVTKFYPYPEIGHEH